ncbi:hypothetical protein V6N13_019943 [Hibiscus sabdariffa]
MVCPQKILHGYFDTKKDRLQKRVSGSKQNKGNEDEARVNLDVCESFGLIFDVDRENVDAKLVSQLCGNTSKYNSIASPSVGAAGDIISMGELDFFVCKDNRISLNFLVILGKISGTNFECALVNVYAPNDEFERVCMFNELRTVLSTLKIPIIMGGDFNTVVSKEEKYGVTLSRMAMLTFSEFIDDLCLVDFPLHGGKFTWSNLREYPSFSRLDRFLLSSDIL